MNPLISVIVPVYKVEKYLHRCIDSLINQTYKNLEIILVDDGSPDNCGKICVEYAKKDSRIKVIQKENGGQASARNMALDIAKGEYIGFVDSDDYIKNDMYEYLYNGISRYNADISVCGITYVSETQKKFIYGDMFFSESTQVLDTVQTLKAHCQIKLAFGPCNKLYSRKIWENMRFPICFREDEAIMYRLMARSSKTVWLSKCKYLYVQRKGSSERSKYDKKYLISLQTADQTYEFIEEKYPEAEKEAWDMRIQMRIQQLDDIIAFGDMDEQVEITNSLIDFLKENKAHSDYLIQKADLIVRDRYEYRRKYNNLKRKRYIKCVLVYLTKKFKIYEPLIKLKHLMLRQE